MRLLAVGLFVALLSVYAAVVLFPPKRALTEPDTSMGSSGRYIAARAASTRKGDAMSGSASATYRSLTARQWAMRFRYRTRQLHQARALARRRWEPTTGYALRLAASVYSVPYSELRAVAWCESRLFPFARNGQYLGLFQLSWSPFGFSPFDPVASALSAAATVKREGWRQWECKP